jgi:hypothetical protein
MRRIIQLLLVTVAVFAIAALLYAQPYLWLTNQEVTRFNDRIKFWHGDTLDGPVHSNGEIAIMQDPVFLGTVSTTEEDFWRGAGYNPQFLGQPPIFNAPVITIPDHSAYLRSCARAQGYYYNEPGKSYWAHFCNGQVKMAKWTTGLLPDTTDSWIIPLDNSVAIYCEGPLDVFGIIRGGVTIGSSHVIRILDDLRYEDTNERGEWLNPDTTHPNILGLLSSGEIKVANTWANGRNNSNGLGVNQTNPDSTNCVITASMVALGEGFTFEQQNDPDSGYICTTPCNCTPTGQGGGPDDRGILYIFGSITQMRRGYVHRSICTSTGYRQKLRYDSRLYNHVPPCLFGNLVHAGEPIDFGDVSVGQVARDTVLIYTMSWYNSQLGVILASYPFSARQILPSQRGRAEVIVSFAPTRAGTFSGMLTVSIGPQFTQFPLRGRGIQGAPPLALDVSPNPFNMTTTLRYSVPDGQSGKMRMFDVLGRTVHEFDLTGKAGQQAISFNGSMLATGVYFVRLEAAGQVVTRKVLLLK